MSSAQFMGNLLLIDFWASWCLPCREEFPELECIYKQNKSIGFNILRVSIDDSHLKWLNAIEKDKITWENVISPGGFKILITVDFQIFAIPSNYLLNKEGVVIAKDVNTQELDSVLKKKTHW
ncbi:TlpA disulfide reductase family protein [Arenibacter sp. M-2]|uniref:TlpA family protein disulfide reductase n=1 Tax=Arenibacter sp. M-2 TaxID=3053612 RepID=UPI00256FC9C8|nr:TlpA disulfide reductase family protein [Arenibacter sp. M-2]MDL5514946.1 TlpA disulfide reductase family protein [Arenibacter sp. M-2]